MAIYRTPSRRPLIVTGIVALVVGLGVGFLLGQSSAPGLASQLSTARAEVRPVLTALDVVRIEYDSLLTGGDSGSPDAIVRAQDAFGTRRATFELLDPDATARLDQALLQVAALVAAKAPKAELDAAVDAAETVAAELSGQSSGGA